MRRSGFGPGKPMRKKSDTTASLRKASGSAGSGPPRVGGCCWRSREEELFTVDVDDLGFQWLRHGGLIQITH